MTDSLNSPIAVVAILAGLAVFMREMVWMVKSLKGGNHTANLEKAFEKFAVTIDKLNDKIDANNVNIQKNNNLIEVFFDRNARIK